MASGARPDPAPATTGPPGGTGAAWSAPDGGDGAVVATGDRFGVARLPGRFGLVVAMLAIALALIASVVLGTFALLVPAGVGRTVATLLAQNAAFALAVGVVALLAGPVRRADLGLAMPPRPWIAVLVVVVGFVGYLVASAVLLGLLNARDVTDTNPQNLGITDGLGPALAVGSVATTATPLAEELLFRLVLFCGLARTLARVLPSAVAVGVAAVLAGSLFGSLHLGSTTPILTPALMLFGVLLCLSVWATRSLVPAVVIHALNNAIAVGGAGEFSALGTVALAVGSLLAIALVLVALAAIGRRTGPIGVAPAGGGLARL